MWPNGKRFAVSLTYDDGQESQLDLAVPDLESRNFRATFFLPPGIFNIGERSKDWAALFRRGHEIGDHSFNHPQDNLASLTAEEVERGEFKRCEAWLDENIGADEMRTYAYVGGATSLRATTPAGGQAEYLAIVRRNFLAARVTLGDPSSMLQARSEPHLIAANIVTWGHDNADQALDYIDQAANTKDGWAVLVFHDITPGPAQLDRQTSREVHLKILDHLASRQDVWVAPFKQVYRAAF